MSAYVDRPWLASYPPGQATDITLEHPSLLAGFAASVAARPDAPAILYFDALLTFRQLDEQSNALACALLAGGLGPGDRVALYLQNVPQYVIAMLATWKAGGVAVAVNPMNKVRELDQLLGDSGASVLVTLESLHEAHGAEAVARHATARRVITTSGLEYQIRHDPRLFAGARRVRLPDTEDFAELVTAFAGKAPPAVSPTAGDTAFLTYTSGTTGRPKGAMNTHGNIAAGGQWYRDWNGLTDRDSVLGIAPLFHVTGLSGHMAPALLTGIPLILTYRFEPGVVIEAIREHRPTFTVAAITAYVALANAPGVRSDDLASFTKLLTGGAPVAPAVVNSLEQQFGAYIHNVYGMTETTSPTHATPMGGRAPIDPRSGALSVGLPVPGLDMAVIGDDDAELTPGQIGELVVRGPAVVPGYWNKPDETAKSFLRGMLRTGDVGFMDEAGWFYIVDRKKDMISAAGYKVWPRDVEDVLYSHEAVRQAAVVGVPDPYRGETVKAYVSLRPGRRALAADLVAFCRERLAAYKVPRDVEVLDELPATVTGKILRRELRDHAARGPHGRPRRAGDGVTDGAEPVPGLDLPALEGFLAAAVPAGLAGPLRGTLLAGGRSNLTYLLEDGADCWVLRRPPLGHVLETAHDMTREVTVLRALASTKVPVPGVVAACDDTAVIGAPFYLMRYVDGTILRTREQLAALSAEHATRMSYALVDVLADLHQVDPAAVGLGEFGRPEGFLQRQLRRWGKQQQSSRSRDIPRMDELPALLAERLPVSPAPAVVHGDYRQDNVILAAEDPGRVLAVLDWEMATVGDPFTDVAMLAVYWQGWAGLDNPITGIPGDHAAFPRQGDLLERYCARTGADLADLDWYLGLAFYKLAVILEGIHYRYAQGQTVGEGFDRIGAMVPELVRRGIAVLEPGKARHGLPV